MAFSSKLGNSGGLNRTFGSAQPQDEKSNAAGGSGKRIGPIKGRITKSKGGHNAGTSVKGNANGLKNYFGSAIAVDEGDSSLPSRGNKDGG